MRNCLKMANYERLTQTDRENLKMYKLEPLVLNSILTTDVKLLRDIFSKHKFEIRIVGGAVRDLLMGERPKNLNFVTTATTNEMKDILMKEQILTINSSEEKYGVIRVSINSSDDMEISQINVATAGQPTESDWRLDSEKRDFTINAMFLDFDGNIYDHCGGYEDLKERKVRFITDAESSIEIDGLRIIRYFRFHGKIAENPANHEGLILLIIMKIFTKHPYLPVPLLWNELKMILQHKSREIVIQSMVAVKIGHGLFANNLAEFQKVSRKDVNMELRPIILLAALCEKIRNATRLWEKLQLSNEELEIMKYIIRNRSTKSLQGDNLLPILKRMYFERLLSTENVKELLQYQGKKELIDELQTIPKFPIEQIMLATTDKANRKHRFVVEELVTLWYESNYNLSAVKLLKLKPNIERKFEERLNRSHPENTGIY